MSYECTEKTITVAAIRRGVGSGEYSFDNIVQRGLVWNPQQKSDLIYSLAMGLRNGEMLAKRVTNDDGTFYDVFDGKQRMNTIYQYLEDAFRLKTVRQVTYVDGNKKKKTVDISGKLFSELPRVLQSIIEERALRLVVYDDITEEELIELFILVNNGKPLSPKSKALAHCNDRENMLRIGQHSIFNSSLLKKKGRENKDEVVIIAKCWMMLNQSINEVNFGSRSLNSTIEDIKVSKADEKVLVSIFDYADSVLAELNKQNKKLGKMFVKEVHFVSLVPYMKQAIDKKITVEKFAEFIAQNISLEDKIVFSEAYKTASMQGAASMKNIQDRNKEIDKAFKKAFK